MIVRLGQSNSVIIYPVRLFDSASDDDGLLRRRDPVHSNGRKQQGTQGELIKLRKECFFTQQGFQLPNSRVKIPHHIYVL